MSFLGHRMSASPVLTVTPQATHHRSIMTGFRSVAHPAAASFSSSPSPGAPSGAWAATPRGRKRSRDEAAVNLDSCAQSEPSKHTIEPFAPSNATATQPTVFNVQTPLPLAAPAQPVPLPPQPTEEDRPLLRSHKSQRLDQSAINANSAACANGPSTQAADGSGQPVIDDFTVHLGIGWRRISGDVDIQAAARGWARYIENHYPVSSAKICLESKGLQSYLVEAAEGYFLFSENLRHGRLVGRNVAVALQNLQASPPVFEGEEMVAGQVVAAVSGGVSVLQGVVHTPEAAHSAMEMDH